MRVWRLFQHINGLSPTSQFSPSGGAGGNAPTRGARMPTGPLGGGGSARIGVLCERGYMARASHSGSCEHGCGDQCSRQKFKLSHLISPLHMKSHVPVFERHFCSFTPEPSLASRVTTRAIAPREGM